MDRPAPFLPDGSPGEVVIRGPGVMSGYVNNPAATAEAFFGDWFRTGDRGRAPGRLPVPARDGSRR